MQFSSFLTGLGWLTATGLALAQPAPTTLPLTDLSAFRQPTATNWRIVGAATADPNQPKNFTTQPGTGILANAPGVQEYGQKFNLMTVLEHGDADLELEFMMVRGSNSGIYLQGRYEVQLFDSWGVRSPKVVDNGSIYERWDDAKQQGYEGHPARQNASRAPGLWQRLTISFQAPRFDAGDPGGAPRKTENARFLRIELNGVLIHENVELTGPTRAALLTDEKPAGPLMIQGDHGAVAFRNIRYTLYGKPRPELKNLAYTVYKGKFDKEPDVVMLPPEAKGPATGLLPGVGPLRNEYAVRYTGLLHVTEPGEYALAMTMPGASGSLRVNNKPLFSYKDNSGTGKVTLPAGDIPIEVIYAKSVEWIKPALTLAVAGPGIRQFLLTPASDGSDETDPILVEATQTPVLRSFMDLPGIPGERGRAYRITHGASVGSTNGVHYTYDLDKGALAQVWRGQFLDATPMWNNRGDGSSRPQGMVLRFGRPALFLATMPNANAAWPTDTTGSGFRPKGYTLDEQDQPTFRYLLNGSLVEDQIRPLENGQGFRRTVTRITSLPNQMARLAEGKRITVLENGLYVVDDQFYVRIDSGDGGIPTVRTSGGQQELVLPVREKLSYSILF